MTKINTDIEVVITPINKTNGIRNKNIHAKIERIKSDKMIISTRIPINQIFFYDCVFKLGGVSFIKSIIRARKHSIAFHRHLYEVDLIGLTREELISIRVCSKLSKTGCNKDECG